MARKSGSRIFVWIIMGLLFVGLLGFGTGNIGGNITSIGQVGSKDLTVSAYQRAVSEQIRSFEAQTGQPLTFAQANDLGLPQLALSQLIASRTMDDEINDLGISVGDERVREQVLAIPSFRGADGNFSREAYRSLLRSNGETESGFETSIRDDLTRGLLQSAVAAGVPPSDIYATTLVQFLSGSRDIVWAAVEEEDLTAPIAEPSEADLIAFHEENAEQFTAPEARDITYAWLTPAMLQDDLEVDEPMVRALYDERIEQFVVPERRLVERLAFLDQDAADAAAARLEAGEIDFEGLVAERGLSLTDIDLGDVDRASLGEAGDAVFDATAGDVVGPFASTLGPALFRMNAILAAQETTFDQARPALAEEIKATRARRVIEDSAETINDLLAGGATLEDLGERSDLEVGTIAWTPETRTGIAAYDTFRQTAAVATEDAFPELVQLSDGGIFALRVDGITPPQLRPFEEVRDDVREAWITSETAAAIEARAKELAEKIDPLTNLATLSLAPKVERGLIRRSFVEGTPPGFIETVFDMEIGDVEVIESVGRSLLVRLDAINEPDMEAEQTQAELEALSLNATSGIAQDLYSAVSVAIQQDTDVALDQAAITAVNASFP